MRENFLLTPAYARLPPARTASGGGGEETKLGRGRVQDMHLAFFQTRVGQSKGNLLFKSVFDLQKTKTKNKPGQNLDRLIHTLKRTQHLETRDFEQGFRKRLVR